MRRPDLVRRRPSFLGRAAAAVVAAVLSAPLVSALALDVPSGWTQRVHEDGLLLQPADLPPGQVMQLCVAPPSEAGRDEGVGMKRCSSATAAD